MRYFIISWLGQKDPNNITYGNTRYKGDTYPPREAIENAVFKDFGAVNITILSIWELNETDFKSYKS